MIDDVVLLALRNGLNLYSKSINHDNKVYWFFHMLNTSNI